MKITAGLIAVCTILLSLINSESHAQVASLQFYRPVEKLYEIVMPCVTSAKLRELVREAGLHAEETVGYDDLVTFQIQIYGPTGVLDEGGQSYTTLSVYMRDDRATAKQYIFSYGYIKGPLRGQNEFLSDKLEDWGYYRCFPLRAP